MSEQAFPSGSWTADDDLATTLVSELLERLLDLISRPDHDWPLLERQTRTLGDVVTSMAAAYPSGAEPSSDR